jgi:hypothetical protein
MQIISSYLLALFATLLVSNNAFASTNPDTLKDNPNNPFRIFAIYHDDVPLTKKASVQADYIQPFTTEFEKITGRKISVIFDENRPPYSNFNYKNDDENKALDEWRELARRYKSERRNDVGYSGNDRILLITNDFINGSPVFGGVGGIALLPGNAAIASLDFKQAIGHELGHTFNAVHEEGEVHYNGWWCETFMFPPLPIRSNCLTFSEGNKKRIKDYVESLY